jgi:hypothetical protein
LGDRIALDEEEAADLLLVGQGRSHVVDGAAPGQELPVL